MNPLPGEIWLADLGLAGKTRPVVIVSRQDPEPPQALVLYVPLTTQPRDSPYEVPPPRLPFLDRESVANVQGLGSLPTVLLNAELAGFPPKSWSDSETRWRLPWIFTAFPINAQPAPQFHLDVMVPAEIPTRQHTSRTRRPFTSRPPGRCFRAFHISSRGTSRMRSAGQV